MFLLGVCNVQKITAYIVATELAPFKNQIAVATVLLAFDNIAFPLSSIYFRFISNNWRPVGYVGIGISFIMAIASHFSPESPRFLADKGDFKQARFIMNRMSRMNKAKLHNKSWKFVEEVKSSRIIDGNELKEKLLSNNETTADKDDGLKMKSNPIKMMLNNPKLVINLTIATISWIACSFNYFLVSYDVKNLGGNIFLNSSLIAFAGVTGKLITLAVRKYTTSRNSLFICFIVVLIPGFGLVFFKEGWLIST